MQVGISTNILIIYTLRGSFLSKHDHSSFLYNDKIAEAQLFYRLSHKQLICYIKIQIMFRMMYDDVCRIAYDVRAFIVRFPIL